MQGLQPRLERNGVLDAYTGALRGEVIMTHAVHKTFFSDKANCRNAANGLMKRKDGEGSEHLQIICYDCLFDDLLAVRHGVQGAVQTVALHGESPVFRDIPLPGDGLDPLEQLVEGAGGEAAHDQQHPFPEPGTDVGPGQARFIGIEIDPAVFRADIGHVHMAQLIAHQSLQPEQAGNTKFKIQFSSSLLLENLGKPSPVRGRC